MSGAEHGSVYCSIPGDDTIGDANDAEEGPTPGDETTGAAQEDAGSCTKSHTRKSSDDDGVIELHCASLIP